MQKENKITMGNFFSGSGTWELAAKMCGIDVLFESEIEPFPVELEAKRFSEAIQLGDISKVNGAEIPPVDILTNSSPCQDLSVAGKRAGLDGERSGLFLEVIRITKEMRNADEIRSERSVEYLRPRFWCWENVPGALSSAGGGQTSEQSSKKQSGLSNQKCMYLSLKNGAKTGLWTEITGNLPGESWMLNTTESPRDAEDCTLSSILLDTVPEKYYLSEKACLGILRRSLKRGKELPSVLKNALVSQAGLSTESYELIAEFWRLQGKGLTAEMIQKYAS